MSRYPLILFEDQIPPKLVKLAVELATRLVDGSSSSHRILQEQLRRAHVVKVELTGAGLFAEFSRDENVPRISPVNITGGDVSLQVQGLQFGAGSLLRITDGAIDFVEIYTFGDEPWPEDTPDVSFGSALPIPIGES